MNILRRAKGWMLMRSMVIVAITSNGRASPFLGTESLTPHEITSTKSAVHRAVKPPGVLLGCYWPTNDRANARFCFSSAKSG